MKKQIPLQQPPEEEAPVRPLMNSIVNPQGIEVEPISETVKKEESSVEENTVQKTAAPQPKTQEEPSRESLLNTRRTPQLQSEENHTHEGSDRQMQSDLRYTSVMRKKKKVDNKEAETKVDSIAGRADNVLMKMKTVFPYDLFPDTVTIDSNKVTIVNKLFFASETVTSILLEEITDVVVESNFFVSQMVITYSHHPLKPLHYKIPNLPKKEALRASEIIQGLLVLRISEGIDLSKLQPEDITKELSNIGKVHEHLPAV